MFQYSGPGSQQVSNRWGDSRTIWHKASQIKDILLPV